MDAQELRSQLPPLSRHLLQHPGPVADARGSGSPGGHGDDLGHARRGRGAEVHAAPEEADGCGKRDLAGGDRDGDMRAPNRAREFVNRHLLPPSFSGRLSVHPVNGLTKNPPGIGA